MLKYLVAFVLLTPWIGIWLVEQGEYAMSIGVLGEPNGATFAFGVYVVLVAGISFFFAKISFRKKFILGSWHPVIIFNDFSSKNFNTHTSDRDYYYFSRRLMSVTTGFLIVMLFGFGGIQVWLGNLDKGIFRTSLGPFGALAYLFTKFTVPALFAYFTMLFLYTDKNVKKKRLWYINAFLVFLAGSTWGFKTTGVFMLLPAILLINWQISGRRIFILFALFFISLIFFVLLFDSALLEDVDIITFLLARLTVLQGDVAWHVWGLYQEGQTLPNYWPTLLAAFGDTVLSNVGISKINLEQWMAFHYDWMITYVSGSPLEQIAGGHSVTATPFAEGVIAGGWLGLVFFATIAGIVVGRSYFHLNRALNKGKSIAAALLSTYFCFHVFSWLNGGAITQLFHVSVLLYISVTYFAIKIMSGKFTY